VQNRVELTFASSTFCYFVLSIVGIIWHNQAAMIQMRRAERGAAVWRWDVPALGKRCPSVVGEWNDE
jgi:hypothetical protein